MRANFGVRQLAAALVKRACSRRLSNRHRLAEPWLLATAASCLTESSSKLPHSKFSGVDDDFPASLTTVLTTLPPYSVISNKMGRGPDVERKRVRQNGSAAS
jgi:hypothetical protein